MKTLYLHIGTPKTGTTSIQSFCTDNLEILHRFGYDYPEFPYVYPRTNQNRNGAFLSGYCFDENGERNPAREAEVTREAFQTIQGLFQTYDHIILSDESIWNRGIREDVPIWERVSEQMETGGFAVKVIVYFRPQYDFLYSWWNQKVKNGLYAESVLTWEEMQQHLQVICLDYRKLLTHIAAHVGTENVIVRIFDRSQFVDGDLYHDFVDAIGLPYEDAFRVGEELHNVSLSRNGGEIKRILNTMPDMDAKLNAMLRDMLLEQSAQRRDRAAYSMFSEEERKAFDDQFEEGNREVARIYLGRETLFPMQRKQEIKWEPQQANLTEDVIYFMGRYISRTERELRELRGEVKELRAEIADTKKQVRGIRSILKNPAAAVGRKLFHK